MRGGNERGAWEALRWKTGGLRRTQHQFAFLLNENNVKHEYLFAQVHTTSKGRVDMRLADSWRSVPVASVHEHGVSCWNHKSLEGGD